MRVNRIFELIGGSMRGVRAAGWVGAATTALAMTVLAGDAAATGTGSADAFRRAAGRHGDSPKARRGRAERADRHERAGGPEARHRAERVERGPRAVCAERQFRRCRRAGVESLLGARRRLVRADLGGRHLDRALRQRGTPVGLRPGAQHARRRPGRGAARASGHAVRPQHAGRSDQHRHQCADLRSAVLAQGRGRHAGLRAG